MTEKKLCKVKKARMEEVKQESSFQQILTVFYFTNRW